jgi:hypothetical protein
LPSCQWPVESLNNNNNKTRLLAPIK